MRNVLILSDDPARGVLLRRWVEAADFRPVVLAGRERLLLDSGSDDSFDLVVYDLAEDSPASRRLLRRFAEDDLFESVPVLRFRRPGDFGELEVREDGVDAALSLPMDPEPGEFAARLRLGAEIGRLRRERNRSALRDAMTGVYHRRYLLHRLESEFSRARRHRLPLSLVLLDVDRLREINESLGEEAGDSVIRRIGALLRDHVRKEDVLARTGEESFGILLSGNRYRGAAVLANKVRTEVEGLAVPRDPSGRGVRVSAGVSSYPDNPSVESAQDLLRAAEHALREAKARGGNRVHVDPEALGSPNPRVVLVDQDASLASLLEDLLAVDDLDVEAAASAEEGLEILRARGADLVVVDLPTLASPGAPPFLEELPRLLGGRRLPLVALARFEPDAGERLPHGVDRFLTKPFSVSVLRGLIRELLDAYAVPAPPN
jgi:diguanylate cyclase (GGDEF)-like protein